MFQPLVGRLAVWFYQYRNYLFFLLCSLSWTKPGERDRSSETCWHKTAKLWFQITWPGRHISAKSSEGKGAIYSATLAMVKTNFLLYWILQSLNAAKGLAATVTIWSGCSWGNLSSGWRSTSKLSVLLQRWSWSCLLGAPLLLLKWCGHHFHFSVGKRGWAGKSGCRSCRGLSVKSELLQSSLQVLILNPRAFRRLGPGPVPSSSSCSPSNCNR